jgi:hypothetical protein
MKKAAQATAAIVKLRVQAVLELRLAGMEGWNVRRFVAEQEAAGVVPWIVPEGSKPLSERQIRNYVTAADRAIEEEIRHSRHKFLIQHLAMRKKLYRRAVEKDDQKTALAILDSMAQISGLWDYEVRQALEQLRQEMITRLGGNNERFGALPAGPAPTDLPGDAPLDPTADRSGAP